MGIWAYLRHWINLTVLYSLLTTFKTVGPYELNWETQQYKCWISQIITFSLLASLQGINLFWFYLITKIAVKSVFVHEEVKDIRSDYEEEEDELRAGKANGNGTLEDKKRAANMPIGDEGMVEKKGSIAPEVLLNGHPVEANGDVGKYANGHANGTADGHANGHMNGTANKRKESKKGI